MVAMIFLLYDLCITPVAIAWDFPMSGWLLCPGAREKKPYGLWKGPFGAENNVGHPQKRTPCLSNPDSRIRIIKGQTVCFLF